MNYDVIVVGFGTAGSKAAIAAARNGAKTLVLEKSTYPGGMHTGGYITEYFLQGPSGISAELEKDSKEMMASGAYMCNVEPRKLAIENTALKAGVDIRYGITLLSATANDRRIEKLCWLENGERLEASAKIIIDATAEGDVACMAGCEFIAGRQWDGGYQHSSNIFECLKENKRYAYTAPSILVNQDRLDEFSKETLKSTANIPAVIGEYADKHRLTMPSDLPGIREGRHIVSNKQITIQDALLSKADPKEPIAYAYSAFDTNITDSALESDDFQDWMIVAPMWGAKLWFVIERDALIPHDTDNLLAAGRHFACDHDTGNALRMNSLMSSLGEAAGIIGALSARSGTTPREIPYAKIREKLSMPDSPLSKNAKIWGLSDQEIASVLNSDKPSRAIWSAYRNEKTSLLKKINSESAADSNAHVHSAFALALLNNDEVIPQLRAIVTKHDNTAIYSDDFDFGVKEPAITTHRGYVSAYLLGRMRDVGSIDCLAEVLTCDDMEYKFNYHSYAAIALLKIGEKHMQERERIAKILRPIAESETWTLTARFIKWAKPEIRVDSRLRTVIAKNLNEWGIPHSIPKIYDKPNKNE